MNIRERLFDLKDEKYGDFGAKLTPNVPREKFIGVRAPHIKKLAKEICKMEERKAFLQDLPHEYVEEYLLHIQLINIEKDFKKSIERIEEILPFIDNWMTCDGLRPVVFKKHLEEAEVYAKKWVNSKEPYISRFGIEILMCYYLDDAFNPKYLEWVSHQRIEHYYHKMMIAWFFATALAKQYDETLPFIQNRKLEKWTHNKAIQKAKESYRVSNEHKEELNRLKWK